MEASQTQSVASPAYKSLKWLGALTSIAMLVLFGWMVSKYLNRQDIWAYIYDHWNTVLLAVLVYCIAWIPISSAWVVLARQSQIKAKIPVLLGILYLSQAAKYLPGNIGQYVGRIYLANRSGIKLKQTALAMALEIATILIACAILTSALFLLNFNIDATLTGYELYDLAIKYAGVGVAIIAVGLFAFILRSNRNRQMVSEHLKEFSIAVGLMMLTVSLFAVSNVFIASSLIEGVSSAVFLSIFSAVVISWFAGFVTPGAPAGIGIREVVFFALLSGMADESALLQITIVFRLVTIVGDLGAFFVGLVLRAKYK